MRYLRASLGLFNVTHHWSCHPYCPVSYRPLRRKQRRNRQMSLFYPNRCRTYRSVRPMCRQNCYPNCHRKVVSSSCQAWCPCPLVVVVVVVLVVSRALLLVPSAPVVV